MTVKLEHWRRAFIPAVAEYANNPKIAENLRDGFPQPYTRTDADQYVSGCIKKGEGEQIFRAITVDGAFAGSIGVFLREGGEAELGYWLGEPFWGRGIMTEAVREICAEAFSRFSIVRIFATPYERNLPSRRVLEKTGFTCAGPTESHGCSRGAVCLYTLPHPAAAAPALRRGDRAVTDSGEVLSILHKCPVLRLGLSDGGQPYVVPLHFAFRARDGALTLYFHCAAAGRKLDLIARNNRVCFEADCAWELRPGAQPCDWSASFESVVGFGAAAVITEDAEKTEAMDLLMARYGFAGTPVYEPSVFARTRMVKIEVSGVTGKRHSQGEGPG